MLRKILKAESYSFQPCIINTGLIGQCHFSGGSLSDAQILAEQLNEFAAATLGLDASSENPFFIAATIYHQAAVVTTAGKWNLWKEKLTYIKNIASFSQRQEAEARSICQPRAAGQEPFTLEKIREKIIVFRKIIEQTSVSLPVTEYGGEKELPHLEDLSEIEKLITAPTAEDGMRDVDQDAVEQMAAELAVECGVAEAENKGKTEAAPRKSRSTVENNRFEKRKFNHASCYFRYTQNQEKKKEVIDTLNTTAKILGLNDNGEKRFFFSGFLRSKPTVLVYEKDYDDLMDALNQLKQKAIDTSHFSHSDRITLQAAQNYLEKDIIIHAKNKRLQNHPTKNDTHQPFKKQFQPVGNGNFYFYPEKDPKTIKTLVEKFNLRAYHYGLIPDKDTPFFYYQEINDRPGVVTSQENYRLWQTKTTRQAGLFSLPAPAKPASRSQQMSAPTYSRTE